MARRSDAEIAEELQAKLAAVTERQATKDIPMIGEMRSLARKLRARAEEWKGGPNADGDVLTDALEEAATELDIGASLRVQAFAEANSKATEWKPTEEQHGPVV